MKFNNNFLFVYQKIFSLKHSGIFSEHVHKLKEYPSVFTRNQPFAVLSKESKTDLRSNLKLKKEKLINENQNDSVGPSAQGTHRRKRWEKLETVYLADDLKTTRRKLWSQEVDIVNLAKEKSKKSLDTSSGKEDSPKTPRGKMKLQVWIF